MELLRKAHNALISRQAEPDAYLFIDGLTEFTHDTPTLFGKPVYHINWVVNPFTNEDYPYVPMWNGDDSMQQVHLSTFYSTISY